MQLTGNGLVIRTSQNAGILTAGRQHTDRQIGMSADTCWTGSLYGEGELTGTPGTDTGIRKNQSWHTRDNIRLKHNLLIETNEHVSLKFPKGKNIDTMENKL